MTSKRKWIACTTLSWSPEDALLIRDEGLFSFDRASDVHTGIDITGQPRISIDPTLSAK